MANKVAPKPETLSASSPSPPKPGLFRWIKHLLRRIFSSIAAGVWLGFLFRFKPAEFQQMRVYALLTGTLTTNLIILGQKLGLYNALAAQESPCTPEDLAKALNLHPRYVAEWCRQQASAGIISMDKYTENYYLSKPQKEVLVHISGENKPNPLYLLGALEMVPPLTHICEEKLPEAFKTGNGIMYDEYGNSLACGMCGALSVWFQNFLIQRVHSIPGLAEKLAAGIKVADIGCGSGEALLVLAEEFPNSTFHGYDTSERALKFGRKIAENRGFDEDKVKFFHVGVDSKDLPESVYDVITTFDALHDMAKPFEVMASVHKTLKPNGWWIIGEMQTASTHLENVHYNPFAMVLYGFSCHICLPSSMAAPEPAALGTLGLSEELLRGKLREAGFKSMEVLNWKHPVNKYYLVKKNGWK